MSHPALPRSALLLLICIGLLAACGQATPAADPTTAPTSAPVAAPTATAAKLDLGGLKVYLVQKTTALTASTAKFRQDSDRYYELAKAANFDYTALWENQRAAVTQAIERARGDWIIASPTYEQMEGIVAGTPSLMQYDVILDAGASGSEGGDNVSPIDLTLPDGRTLPKPGNLFGITESTLWGTDTSYVVPDLLADYNGNGTKDFGETLPDANALKGGADALDKYANELHAAAQAWQPVEAEAFGALVNNVPTVTDFFEAWKESRFVAGAASKRRDFAVVSRLSDIVDNISSWQVIYQDLSPAVRGVDAAQDAQIGERLTNLKSFVGDLYAQEQDGKRFSPEEADLLSAEAGNRATAIAGQISQVAAKLNIPLQ
jgi:Imelysin